MIAPSRVTGGTEFMQQSSGRFSLAPYLMRCAAACALALSNGVVQAATFAPITGSLAIRAGSKPPQTTPAVIGSANLTDFDFPAAVASASFLTSIPNTSQFNYSATASSSSNSQTTVIPPSATANANFEQSFTTAAQQWIEVNGTVLSPADPGVSAFVTFGRTGQAPLVIIGDTAGGSTNRAGLYAPGTYSIKGNVNTQATVAPAHAGAVSGYVLIAALGDFNGNLVVDAPDFTAWKAGFGSKTGTFASGNLDGDTDTDGADFLLLQHQLGTHALSLPAANAVPEPATALLAACGLAIISRARRIAHCRTNRSAARRAAMSPAK
jgi:hypothetical protein